MGADIFFFTDVELLAEQTAEQAFGPVRNNENSQYRVTSLHSKKNELPIGLTDIKPNGKKEYSLIEHSKICGGGNTIFISGKSSEIIYLTKRQIFGYFFLILNSSKYNYHLNQILLDILQKN